MVDNCTNLNTFIPSNKRLSKSDVSKTMKCATSKLKQLEYCVLCIEDEQTQDSTWIEFAQHWSSLNYLFIDAPNLDNNEFKKLFSFCRNLKGLQIDWCSSEGAIQSISVNVRQLQILEIYDCNLNDAMLREICNSNACLEEVWLTGCQEVTKSGNTSLLNNCKILKYLNVAGCNISE